MDILKKRGQKRGYARVSTKDQNAQRQIEELKRVEVTEENIYLDKASGKNFDRPAWQKLLADLVMGDTLIVTELDRLGRNKREMIKTFELMEAKGVYIENLNMPFLNTKNENEVMREVLQPAVLTVLSYFAEKEREVKRERQSGAYKVMPVDSKGRKISLKKNKVIGRPSKKENLTKEQLRYIKAWIAGEIKTSDCIKSTDIGRATLFVIKKDIIGKEKI